MKKWRNLLDERCPLCGARLFYKKDTEKYECALFDENPKGPFSCDFEVSPQKLQELKQKVSRNQDLKTFDHDNSHFLNNYKIN